MAYTIQFKKSALKELYNLPKNISQQIAQAINDLAKNPRPNGCKKLKGQDNLYRVRSGTYRVVYQIHDKVLIVLVLAIGDRKEVYLALFIVGTAFAQHVPTGITTNISAHGSLRHYSSG
jgi:mRNA interferase RelE/StbE